MIYPLLTTHCSYWQCFVHVLPLQNKVFVFTNLYQSGLVKILLNPLWFIGNLLVNIGSHWQPMPTNPLLVILYTSPNLNRQYQNGQNTNQNQKKNACPFYTVFQVLEVLLIKICKIQPLDLLFLVIFISFYINRYHISPVLKTSFSII